MTKLKDNQIRLTDSILATAYFHGNNRSREICLNKGGKGFVVGFTIVTDPSNCGRCSIHNIALSGTRTLNPCTNAGRKNVDTCYEMIRTYLNHKHGLFFDKGPTNPFGTFRIKHGVTVSGTVSCGVVKFAKWLSEYYPEEVILHRKCWENHNSGNIIYEATYLALGNKPISGRLWNEVNIWSR